MIKYDKKNLTKMYCIRDLSRGKLTEAINSSSDQPVLIIKNSKPKSVAIDYKEYLKLIGENTNEKM